MNISLNSNRKTHSICLINNNWCLEIPIYFQNVIVIYNNFIEKTLFLSYFIITETVHKEAPLSQNIEFKSESSKREREKDNEEVLKTFFGNLIHHRQTEILWNSHTRTIK